MDIALVTGSGGLIGSEAVRFLMDKGLAVCGIDNDMRSRFFGEEASTRWNRERLEKDFPEYKHYDSDIRSEKDMERL
ncbi:MAG: NAD-dependent epimerase/dehydratase family protein, partial [Nitrospinaceae bacterium]